MDTNSLPVFGTNIDRSQVPPIHQKRILAFVNNFIVNTVTFLNKFMVNCEMKFIDVERKLQKIEASLLIIEGKLSSINGIDNSKSFTTENKEIGETHTNTLGIITNNEKNPASVELKEVQSRGVETKQVEGIKTSEDVRYRKYFKMLLFGVPVTAVKIKMSAEGVNPNILDDPDKILHDEGVREINENE